MSVIKNIKHSEVVKISQLYTTDIIFYNGDIIETHNKIM